MARYRKKPVVIEAEQWFEGKQIEGVTHGLVDFGTAAFYVETLEGRMIVRPGDWIITGVAGEKYPCKDAIFRVTYEPVVETVAPRDEEPPSRLSTLLQQTQDYHNRARGSQ